MSRQFPGDAAIDLGASMVVDLKGNMILAGHFSEIIDLQPRPSSGSPWQHHTSTGLRDIFVVKLDPSGEQHLWSRSFGDSADQVVASIAVDPANNVLVAGSFGGTLDFGGMPLTSAGHDIFLAKFDPDGNHLWSARFGDTSLSIDALQEATGIAVDAEGNVLLTGQFAGTSSFGGSPLASAGGTDVFVAKYDSSGNYLWSKRFGDAASQAARALAVDATGNVWLTGDFSGTLDFGGGALAGAGGTDVFVAKLDPSGSHLFSHRFGDSQHQSAGSIAVDAAGHAVVTGSFTGTVHFGTGSLTSVGASDVYVAKFDTSGEYLWSKQFPGNGTGKSVASDADGNVAIVGNFLDTIDLGSGPSPSTGERDIFLVKLAP